MKNLTNQLIRHEGFRQHPYKDSVGILTVGVGRNLKDVGISEDEAKYLLQNDIKTARDELLKRYPAFNTMTQVRQDVLINMVFNIGIARFQKFKNMIKALIEQDYVRASEEMLDSLWAKQVGKRAIEMSEQMRTNEYQV